jgi:anaerobic selenocysteine-containing dehydrogenase
LAERLGFDETCFRETVDEMIDVALDSQNNDPWMEGIDRSRLEQGFVRLNFSASGSGLPASDFGGDGAITTPTAPFLPFAQGNFRTASGKAELYSEALRAEGLDPVAEFTPPSESRYGANRNGENGNAFPLELLARKSDNFLNSTFSNLPSLQELEEPGLLEMCAADARARGIADGDQVRVYNRRGEMNLKARVDGAVQPGVVSARLNWAKTTKGFQSINSLTSEKLTDMGNSATFYSVLVEVERIQPKRK